MDEKKAEWQPWIMGISSSLLVAAATGLYSLLGSIESDIQDLKDKDVFELKKELAVLKTTFEKTNESQLIIGEMRFSGLEQRDKDYALEIDKLKHNNEILEEKLLQLSERRRR